MTQGSKESPQRGSEKPSDSPNHRDNLRLKTVNQDLSSQILLRVETSTCGWRTILKICTCYSPKKLVLTCLQLTRCLSDVHLRFTHCPTLVLASPVIQSQQLHTGSHEQIEHTSFAKRGWPNSCAWLIKGLRN